MQPLHCDKPYNLDEAAARRGTPRRKRKDSRTTAYELTIRIPEEHRRHFGGKKKLTRVVFALNKKVDLKGQVRAFEEEKNAVLDLALEARGGGSLIWQHFFGQIYERIRPASLNPAGAMQPGVERSLQLLYRLTQSKSSVLRCSSKAKARPRTSSRSSILLADSTTALP